jgi:hypothetical protein
MHKGFQIKTSLAFTIFFVNLQCLPYNRKSLVYQGDEGTWIYMVSKIVLTCVQPAHIDNG